MAIRNISVDTNAQTVTIVLDLDKEHQSSTGKMILMAQSQSGWQGAETTGSNHRKGMKLRANVSVGYRK